MNIQSKIPVPPNSCHLPVFIDISKDYLDYTVGVPSRQSPCQSGRISYRIQPLTQWMDSLVDTYELAGPHQLELICEPTGGLQHKLVLLSEKYQAKLRYVDSERMYNARMITYGNAEKTDAKDPGAMSSLYVMGKYRAVPSTDILRESVRAVSRQYEDVSQQAISCRNRIHQLIGYVFPDYDKPIGFTFSASGQALAAEFGFCPQRIVQAGYQMFRQRLQGHVKRIRHQSTQQLWQQAVRSVELTDADFADPRADYLQELYRRWVYLEGRKSDLKRQLIEYAKICRQEGWFPKHLPPSISEWMLVRVVAESGPFTSFNHIRQLWVYLGLKLARRQSGTYKGHLKITKKGSPLARKLLYQMCLPLVKSNGWMRGTYLAQNPNGAGNGKGIRALTVAMRKLVKVLFAMHQSGQPFDPKRVGCCQSQYSRQHCR
jgi:transposase